LREHLGKQVGKTLQVEKAKEQLEREVQSLQKKAEPLEEQVKARGFEVSRLRLGAKWISSEIKNTMAADSERR